MSKTAFWVLIFLLLSFNTSWSQETDRGVKLRTKQNNELVESPYGNSWALLIGVNKYKNFPARLQLNYAVNDVKALQELLVNPSLYASLHLTGESVTPFHPPIRTYLASRQHYNIALRPDRRKNTRYEKSPVNRT